MNSENTEKLVSSFPTLYRTTKFFQCGDGWFDLIFELSEKLAQIPSIAAVQVKEKFGSLRFYIQESPVTLCSEEFQELYDLIRTYESKSAEICEQCGDPGKTLSPNGWYITLCSKCNEDLFSDIPS